MQNSPCNSDRLCKNEGVRYY